MRDEKLKSAPVSLLHCTTCVLHRDFWHRARQAPPLSCYPQSIGIASWLLAFVSEWCLCRVNVCPLFLAECTWHLAALMFRTANLKTIGKAGTGW